MARMEKNNKRQAGANSEVQEQFIERLVSVRRVTKVVKGGKNMRFSALVIIGD